MVVHKTVVVFLVFLAVAASSLSSEESHGVSPGPKGNILFVAPLSSKSHKMFYYGLIEAMAKDGHKVTVLTPYSPSRKIENVREVVLEDFDINSIMPNGFKDGKLSPIIQVISKGPNMCLQALASKQVEDVLKDNFDMAYVSMFFGECFLGYMYEKQIPFVFVNPAHMIGPFSAARMGNPVLAAIDYNPMFPFPKVMNFFQRAVVTFANTVFSFIHSFSLDRMTTQGKALGLYREDMPHLVEISKNASLMIANSYRMVEHPRAYMPNVLLAGGIHCRPAKPLPSDLEEWVQSAGEAGFIFFSLGSAVRPSDIPESTIRTIVSVFESLPQKVLWKFDLDEVPGGIPKNVRLTKWAPQQDLLGHSKLRLFITHGGIFSTQESNYHGVPVLGLPVFGDQVGNMQGAELEGWGKMLHWEDLTYDLFRSTIIELRDNKEKREISRKLGLLTRDRPSDPAEDVAWWTGYILRTGGAKHLQSVAVHLSWYEIYNVDVWVAFTFVVLFVLWIWKKILVALICKCFGNSQKTSKKKVKKN